MNPDAQYQFIHAVSAVGRLPAVEKAILQVASPQCLLMVTPRSDGDFSVIVGVPAGEDAGKILEALQAMAEQTIVIGGRDTPAVRNYPEGSSEPSIDF